MEVTLTPDQQAFFRHAIESGRLKNKEQAIQEALSLWEERERRRAELLSAVGAADTSLRQNEGRVISEDSILDLAEDIKRRGRAHSAGEKHSR